MKEARPQNPQKEESLPLEADPDEMARFGNRKVPAAEKVRLVQRHFDAIASKYDFMNTLLSFGLHYVWKRRAVRALHLKPGDWVLDVCGGTADLSILAARAAGPEGRVFLYDINRPMMEEGKKKVAKAGLSGGVRFIQGNAEQIAFPEGIFDAAMVGFGIRNVTRVEKSLREMYRSLKPGGKFMCLEFSRPTSRLFRGLYDLYSFRIMPLAGKILAGNRPGYTYLAESIRLFPVQEEFSGILKGVGFSEVTYTNLTNGIAAVHIGIKNSPQSTVGSPQ
ncbi:MAG: bifunctional demethylmenaquinone methyltransferase/2-methoxy-6-polyprenyl-1,4-benzoquinol methylase UbiE [Deltaproteobacteria bacterium]|nr:bifunctional demethylmenaquinone methyltransferase/2-methoxy-6-polyprenyl-1,4-benzoquinol methylase UbiE [Deltaproteobacteria bacterium]